MSRVRMNRETHRKRCLCLNSAASMAQSSEEAHTKIALQSCFKLSVLYQLVAICQQVATNLSISSSCNKSVKIMLVQPIICRLVITC